MSKGDETVKVVVRCRPLNSKEKRMKCSSIVEIDSSLLQVRLSKPVDDDYDAQPPPKAFTFDGVYDGNSQQRVVYDETAFPLVESVLQGYNGTIFAYGQTGCGKTFTMEGKPQPEELNGIIPRAFSQIFDTIAMNEDADKQFLVRASYIEIYNEQVRDLVSATPKRTLNLKETKDGAVLVHGVTEQVVKSTDQIQVLMSRGNKNRAVAFTEMNADSSRSHSIFIVKIETSEPDPLAKGKMKIKAGKLNLVDLAGSERQSKTEAKGMRLREAAKINLSLSALGNVISALVSGKGKHVPYRDSKLTRLLQDSLGGNTKTIMIAAVSPADYNYEETLSTLRYANRAKNIKNKPKINEDPKDALLKQYQEEIARLKAIVDAQKSGVPLSPSNTGHSHHRRMSLVTDATGGVTVRTDETPRLINHQLQQSKEESEKWRRQKEESERMARELEQQIERERAERAHLASQLEQAAEKSQMVQEQQRRAEELEQRLQAQKARAQEIADRMAAEAANQQELQAELERQKRAALEEKNSLQAHVDALQSQLLAGGQKLKDQQAKVQDKLRRAALRLKRERQVAAQLKAERAKAEEAKLLAEEKYSNVEEEAAAKTKKLALLGKKYQEALQENADLQEEFEEQRRGYLDDIRQLSKDNTLQKQILSVFLAMGDLDRILHLASYDEDVQEWRLPHVDVLDLQGRRLRVQVTKHDATGSARRHHSAGVGRAADSTSSISVTSDTSRSSPQELDKGWAMGTLTAPNSYKPPLDPRHRSRGRKSTLKVDTSSVASRSHSLVSPGRLQPMQAPLSARGAVTDQAAYQRAVAQMDKEVSSARPKGPSPAGVDDIRKLIAERRASSNSPMVVGNPSPRWEQGPLLGSDPDVRVTHTDAMADKNAILGAARSSSPAVFSEDQSTLAAAAASGSVLTRPRSPKPPQDEIASLLAPAGGLTLQRPAPPSVSHLSAPRSLSPRVRRGHGMEMGPRLRDPSDDVHSARASPSSPVRIKAIPPRALSSDSAGSGRDTMALLSSVPSRPAFAPGPTGVGSAGLSLGKGSAFAVGQHDAVLPSPPSRPAFQPASSNFLQPAQSSSNHTSASALASPPHRPAFQPNLSALGGAPVPATDPVNHALPTALQFAPSRPQFQPARHLMAQQGPSASSRWEDLPSRPSFRPTESAT